MVEKPIIIIKLTNYKIDLTFDITQIFVTLNAQLIMPVNN